MSRVLVNHLNVRTGPSTSSEKVAYYDAGQIINSGDLLIASDGRIWLRYTGGSGNKRFVCAVNNDGTQYVDVPGHIPGPRKPEPEQKKDEPHNPIPIPSGVTGVPGIPKQTAFPVNCIQKYGCCFLCTCVKGGLTTYDQCMDCFNWGRNSGKLRDDCYVSCNKENWAREISSRYGTPYHGDYCFQKNNHHFWLTQNGREIFNSSGLGYR